MRGRTLSQVLWELTQEDYDIVAPDLTFANIRESVRLAMLVGDTKDAEIMATARTRRDAQEC